MRTLVLSDLHLGTRKRADVLRLGIAREKLAARLQDVERLVLLGDLLELRHAPVHAILDRARPALDAMREALPAGAQVVIVPGNHDHALAAGLLERRKTAGDGPLGLEHRLAAREASPVAAAVEAALAPGRTEIAYPGLWLRDGVYATHGHYLDPLCTVPSFERLLAGAMARVVRPVPEGRALPDDFEVLLAPTYSWVQAAAQWQPDGRPPPAAGEGAAETYRKLTGRGRGVPWRHRALALAFPVAVFALNRLGVGPLSANLQGGELRRSTLRAMAEAIGRLGVEAEHVLFGHTHRTGPLPRDRRDEWRADGGAHLHNTGSWVYETHFMTDRRADSPYWPGGAVALDGEGAPRLERLLADVPAEALAPADPRESTA